MKRSSLPSATLVTLAVATACGSSGPVDAGPPVSAQTYFLLQPGVCFVYQNGGDGGDVVSVDTKTVPSPPGVGLLRSHSGVPQEEDLLVFDAGTAFLAERIFNAAGLTDAYNTPLVFLEAPLASQNLSSQSAYTEATNAGVQTMSTETLTVNLGVATQAWSGFGASAGGAQETKLSFTYVNPDGGTVDYAWFTPGVGFTDLFLANPSGIFVDYLLADAHPDDAGCP